MLDEILMSTFVLTFIFTTLQSPVTCRMYRTMKYLLEKEKNSPIHDFDLQRAVSLDDGMNSLPRRVDFTSSEENGANDRDSLLYLHRTLGEDLLETILTKCAKVQPEDPVLFVAALLER